MSSTSSARGKQASEGVPPCRTLSSRQCERVDFQSNSESSVPPQQSVTSKARPPRLLASRLLFLVHPGCVPCARLPESCQCALSSPRLRDLDPGMLHAKRAQSVYTSKRWQRPPGDAHEHIGATNPRQLRLLRGASSTIPTATSVRRSFPKRRGCNNLEARNWPFRQNMLSNSYAW